MDKSICTWWDLVIRNMHKKSYIQSTSSGIKSSTCKLRLKLTCFTLNLFSSLLLPINSRSVLKNSLFRHLAFNGLVVSARYLPTKCTMSTIITVSPPPPSKWHAKRCHAGDANNYGHWLNSDLVWSGLVVVGPCFFASFFLFCLPARELK